MSHVIKLGLRYGLFVEIKTLYKVNLSKCKSERLKRSMLSRFLSRPWSVVIVIVKTKNWNAMVSLQVILALTQVDQNGCKA